MHDLSFLVISASSFNQGSRMEPFKPHRGKVALLDWTDVNTDLIIPARYLKRIERTGYGPLLFADKRYLPDQAPPPDDPEKPASFDPEFPLNDAAFAGATILLVGRNFGCGSSREHAVWAVAQAGYKVLIAPGKDEGFADIFEQNAFNNGLLPIELPEADWDRLAKRAGEAPPLDITVDLEAQQIRAQNAGEECSLSFDVPPAQRRRLLEGLDAIAETLVLDDRIRQHERTMAAWQQPWTT
jgi:3-isopropylmalate/(R)-2-methylmalate dehydratase small subunit